MKLVVSHRTSFSYESLASQAVTRACLTPRDTSQQTCLSSRVSIYPEPDSQTHIVDRFGNELILFDFAGPHDEASVVSVSHVETSDAEQLPPDCSLGELEQRLCGERGAQMLEAEECLLFSRLVPATIDPQGLFRDLCAGNMQSNGVLEFAQRLNNYIYTNFKYDPTYSSVATPLGDVVQDKRGVCQDFAHTAILTCRKLGIPARYVSGYLETLPPPGVEKMRGADASHAWFSVYVGNGRWIDFDPTNNKRPDHQYVTTAWGRDYSDVAPLRGVVYGGGAQTLDVAVDVDRMPEDSIDNHVTTLTPH